MTVLDERPPSFRWGTQDPTAQGRLPEIVWDDDATREHPDLVAELEALYGIECPPVVRPALARRRDVRNTPPAGIPVRKAGQARRTVQLPAPDAPPERPLAAPVPLLSPARTYLEPVPSALPPAPARELAPARPANRTADDDARRRVVRVRSAKALVMALVVAADTYAAVTLAGPPAALNDVFTSDTDAAPASALTSSTVLAESASRAASALALREETAHVDRSLSDASGDKVRSALGQATAARARAAAAEARAAAVVAAREKALAEARSNPQGIARMMVADAGWNSSQFSCLSSLWHRESGWNYRASNSSSGAYGIPQSLPGSKMASAGSDWRTNPVTQIRWGLDYVSDRYGTPCGAWAHSENHGWY